MEYWDFVKNPYIDCVLKRLNIHNCSLGDSPIIRSDKFNKLQCPKNEFEKEVMKQLVWFFNYADRVLQLSIKPLYVHFVSANYLYGLKLFIRF